MVGENRMDEVGLRSRALKIRGLFFKLVGHYGSSIDGGLFVWTWWPESDHPMEVNTIGPLGFRIICLAMESIFRQHK